MHAGIRKTLETTLAASGLLVISVGGATVRGDEPGLLGRLFRLGGGPPPASSTRSAPGSHEVPGGAVDTIGECADTHVAAPWRGRGAGHAGSPGCWRRPHPRL